MGACHRIDRAHSSPHTVPNVQGNIHESLRLRPLAYGEQLDHLKTGLELPYPLAGRHFKPEVAVRTYAEHLDAWELIDQLGYDGARASTSITARPTG